MGWTERVLQAEIDAGTPLEALAIEDSRDRLTRWILVRGERKHRHEIKWPNYMGERDWNGELKTTAHRSETAPVRHHLSI